MRYSTFASWVQQARVARPAQKPAATTVRFVEACLPGQVQLPAVERVPAVEVRLAEGTVVRGSSADAVVAVLRALTRAGGRRR